MAVVVAVLTYRRNAELAQLIPVLRDQLDDVAAQARVLVVDNDPAGGASSVVAELADPLVDYVAEPTPGIAAGRNKALASVAGDDLLVFIDDDETPQPGWLAAMVSTYEQYRPAAVTGAVVRIYTHSQHPWVDAGVFRDRSRFPTGTVRPLAATNSLLLDMAVIRRLGLTFDAEFGLSGGSDTMFTSRLTAAGERIVWCDEAVVHDPVSAERSTRRWIVRRVFRLGNTWARVATRTARSPRAVALVRARLLVTSAARIVAGLGVFVLGVVTGDIVRRASGVRLTVRGVGIASGALGYVYVEYRRPAAPTP